MGAFPACLVGVVNLFYGHLFSTLLERFAFSLMMLCILYGVSCFNEYEDVKYYKVSNSIACRRQLY